MYKRFIVDGVIVRDVSIEHLRSTVGENASIEKFQDPDWIAIPYHDFNGFAQALEDAKKAGYILQSMDSPMDLSIGFTLEKGGVVEHHTIQLKHLKSQVNPEIRKFLGDVNLREAWIEGGSNHTIPLTPENGGMGNLESASMGAIFYTKV